MERLYIAATDQTPEIEFNAQTRCLRISGVSTPAVAAEWWREPRQWLDDYLPTHNGALTIELQLRCASHRCRWAILSMLCELNNTAARGANIVVNCQFQVADPALAEFAEEIRDTFRFLLVHLAANKRGR
jgi:hypothetical protein